MPIYEYETIPKNENEKPIRLELRQNMSDPVYTTHPETGRPIKRVYAAFSVGASSPTRSAAAPSGGCCCNPGGTCGMN
jgi:hypothetical protein